MIGLPELLLKQGIISAKQLAEAEVGATTEDEIIEELKKSGTVSSEQVTQAVAKSANLPVVHISEFPINRVTVALVPAELCKRNLLIPLEQSGDSLTIAVADPTNIMAIDDVRAATRMQIKVAVADAEEIQTAINEYLRSDEELTTLSSAMSEGHRGEASFKLEDNSEQDAPIVRFVNLLISQAVQDRASDIHIEPTENDLRVRFRIDGVLHEISRHPKSIQAEILSRVKVMSDMDISERRIPQDGRLTFKVGAESRDLRVASLPTVWGEKIVIRILDSRTTNMSFEQLGLNEINLERYRKSVTKPWGMTLVTGPTGSGKTTTLYASLGVVSGSDVNVITVEDPVEYRMEGINQMQVNSKAGLTFANALRSILRADPNIVMVGEIRDHETAQIAVEAALTGHLVLSTLHTNDAPSAATRLLELGVEPFLVTSSLDCVMAQRLARRLCDDCKRSYKPKTSHLEAAGIPDEFRGGEFFEPVGCARCTQTGFRGRIAIQEVMEITDSIESLILDRASSSEIAKVATSEGMISLRTDGFGKVNAGLTSIEEVLRVVA